MFQVESTRGRRWTDVYSGWYDLINIIVLIALVIAGIGFLIADVLSKGAIIGTFDPAGNVDTTATAGVLIGIIISGGVVVGTWVYQECLDRWESGQVVRYLLKSLRERFDESLILSSVQRAAFEAPDCFQGSQSFVYLPSFGTNYSAFYSHNAEKVAALSASVRSSILQAMVAFDALEDIRADFRNLEGRQFVDVKQQLVREFALHTANTIFLSALAAAKIESGRQSEWARSIAKALEILSALGMHSKIEMAKSQLQPYYRVSSAPEPRKSL